MKMNKDYLKETPSQPVYESFRKRRKTFKIPKLKEGIYVIEPRLIGGAYMASENAARAISFIEFLGDKGIKKIYGKQSFLTGEIKNPYAKVVLDFDGIFKEHFTGKKIYALPYRYVDTVDPFVQNKEKVDIYCGETESSLRNNDIDSLFIHLEDIKVLKNKDLEKVYKLYSSDKKLAIFQSRLLEFAQETEEALKQADVKDSKQYLLLRRKEKINRR